METGGRVVDETDEEMCAFFQRPELIHFVGLAQRPGVVDCITTLEHAHYEPETARNALFTLRYLPWENMPWFIVSIPIEERAYMDRVAAAHGLRIADGVPTLLCSEGTIHFPVSNERVFTLENVPGHPVYK